MVDLRTFPGYTKFSFTLRKQHMTKPKDPRFVDSITVEEMTRMFTEELANVHKGAELRIREFATALKQYAAGELTPEQATDRVSAYQVKWGDAVPGVYSVEGKSDAELVSSVDQRAGPFSARAMREREASAERVKNS